MTTKSLFKLILIGDCGVGKTSLLRRFAHDMYAEEYTRTIGVDFKVHELDETTALQIWDISGQPGSNAITNAYCRGAQGVIIVYDITSKESFENAKKRLQEIDHFFINSKVLVGNKGDLGSERQVEFDAANYFADSLDMPFIETSAKNNTNVAKVFLQVGSQMKARAAASS